MVHFPENLLQSYFINWFINISIYFKDIGFYVYQYILLLEFIYN